MSGKVRKNTINPRGSLYHHSLIKLLILDQLKERNQTWDTFVFNVLNPHLNIQKLPRHLHNNESIQTPSTEKKIPNIMHIDEDTSESIPSTHFTLVNPVSAKFLPFPRIRTRYHKEKIS